MAPQPCSECKARPKEPGRHRCTVCRLRHEPIDVQVAAARRRLSMVPEALRRSRVPARLWPPGQRWCAGCQTFVDLVDVPAGAGRCKACQSAATHSAMIERTYGLTREDYDALLEAQGGKCAICRRRPKSKRLAVDHDHKTGAVRGLLCSRCNHDLMGAAWDSAAMAKALLAYLETPPATGTWSPPEDAVASPRAARRADLVPAGGIAPAAPSRAVSAPLSDDGCTREHFLPTGSMPWPGPDERPGLYLVLASDRPDTPPPF